MTKRYLKCLVTFFRINIFNRCICFCYPFINEYTVDKIQKRHLRIFITCKKAMSEDNSPESQLDTDKQSSIYNFNSLYKDMQNITRIYSKPNRVVLKMHGHMSRRDLISQSMVFAMQLLLKFVFRK